MHDRYVVVLNDEEQYSVWDAGRPLPLGWRTNGVAGDREACAEWIETHWTDITPVSARQA